MTTINFSETCFNESDSKLSHGPQRVRQMSEKWAGQNLRCPECSKKLTPAKANLPSLDLLCEGCGLQFELKAKGLGPRKSVIRSLNGGNYKSTVLRTAAPDDSPSLFVIGYDKNSLKVIRVLLHSHQYFVPSTLTERKPLKSSAKRAGWVGCNIQLHLIPNIGTITVFEDGYLTPKCSLQDAWRKSLIPEDSGDMRDKGWLVDIIRVVQGLPTDFSLADIYAHSPELAALHPENRHVKAKIRQQLQVLRNNEKLVFLGRGRYGSLLEGSGPK